MPVKKLTTAEAQKSFQRAVHHTEMAARNPNYPISRESAVATNNYAAATMQLLVQLIDGVNSWACRTARHTSRPRDRRQSVRRPKCPCRQRPNGRHRPALGQATRSPSR